MTTIIVETFGEIPMNKPKATPANETWLSVSLIKLCRRSTRKTPKSGANNDMATIA